MPGPEVIHPLGDDAHSLLVRLARGPGAVEAESVEPHEISLREFVVLAKVDAEPGRSHLTRFTLVRTPVDLGECVA